MKNNPFSVSFANFYFVQSRVLLAWSWCRYPRCCTLPLPVPVFPLFLTHVLISTVRSHCEPSLATDTAAAFTVFLFGRARRSRDGLMQLRLRCRPRCRVGPPPPTHPSWDPVFRAGTPPPNLGQSPAWSGPA